MAYAPMEIHSKLKLALSEFVALSCLWNFLSIVACALSKKIEICLTLDKKFLLFFTFTQGYAHWKLIFREKERKRYR